MAAVASSSWHVRGRLNEDSSSVLRQVESCAASNLSSHESVPKPGSQQLLVEFLKVQERRAGLYSTLQAGFADYLKSGSELSFQQLCGRITTDFNDCSRQVIDIQAALRGPEIARQDLADILQDVQAQEKQNLKMTATLQLLRKAGRPSDRAQAHAGKKVQHHLCSHGHEEESALELAESDAEYDAAYKEATQALQEARTTIHEYMEEVRYELASNSMA
ncbi:uncharacterized protein [Physcomitrium patens]|uniref:Uncharacterized protein n=1 Tax=Physcomitrium patens TaxID=3218 RepID=A0A7I4A6J4_PHYPA|nr:uncharacterized protein LOC112287568 isoform X2 [Physcomitrium patens]|eukprot:XP_024386438.1 uncharacterized protein LOC112287568 isoform X2 [Physcomitrella patens]